MTRFGEKDHSTALLYEFMVPDKASCITYLSVTSDLKDEQRLMICSDHPTKMARSDPFAAKLESQYTCDYVEMANNNRILSDRELGAICFDVKAGATL